MNSEIASIINSLIMLSLLSYAFFIFHGKIYFKKKNDFIEKNKTMLSILSLLSMSYPIYRILSIVLKWN